MASENEKKIDQTSDAKIRKIVMAAVFAALTFVATSVIKIPTPTLGYIHIGDTFVILSGICLPPFIGALAAGLGSALSDLLGGYFIWVPGTFVIKFLAALAASLLYRGLKKLYKEGKYAPSRVIFAGIASETIVVIGYLLFNVIILAITEGAVSAEGLSAAIAASAAEVPFNLLQGTAGIVLSVLAGPVFTRISGKELQQ
ncbi:MAG: ECF transporter S component [Lachnospiraceae bacterium]|nr:ECF transporter S component [Lachnospiraceae bacterium]